MQWVLEISNNPGKEEAKPAFKVILCPEMHDLFFSFLFFFVEIDFG